MRNRPGFTLTEVLIAIVVIAVLAGLAVPNFSRTIEQARSNEAVANLNVIRMGQRIYRLNQGRFWPAPDGTNSTLGDINNNLNVDLDTEFYNTISVTSTGAGTAFTATASRGNAGNKQFTIDQDGNVTESGSY
ncbi:MAG: hypothetical protein MOGMAGMI_00973 [Candidatus Omnitrophica bacterium]|nr:hypothetical protein [Candidatus Omnitrophota bacterium]